MKEEAAIFFSILLVIYLILGLILFVFAFLRNQKEINYLSISYILRAILFIAPSIFIYNINLEFSVWITGPIKVFIIPLNYLFVRKLFERDKSWKKNDIWHFAPFFLDSILTIIVASNHAGEVVNGSQLDIKEMFNVVWEGNFYYTLLSSVARSISFIQWTLYFILSIPLVKKCIHYQKQEKSQINYKYLNWLQGITVLFIIMGFFEGLGIFGVYGYPPVFLAMFFNLIVYAFYFLFFILQFSDEFKLGINNTIDSPTNLKIEEKEDKEWLHRFIELEIFLEPDLTLQKTALLLNLPKYKLTQFIRIEGHTSFYSFVNFYRVKKSKELLLTIPDCQVIESVYRDSGFNSRSTFFRVFKEFTGETPGHYIQHKHP